MARRTHKILRRIILSHITYQPISINELSDKTKIDWYTVERQLNYLKGRELVAEAFRHRQLRLFKITELGKDVLVELDKKPAKKPKRGTDKKADRETNRETLRIIQVIKRRI